MAKRSRKSYPLPEAVKPASTGRRGRKPKVSADPEPWKVKPSRIGAVDLTNREMLVPVGSERREQLIRAHELAHIRWTPKSGVQTARKEEIPDAAIQSAEDCRINGLLSERADVHFDVPVVPDPATFAARMVRAWQQGGMSDLEMAGLFLAGYGTPDYEPFAQEMMAANPRVASEMMRITDRIADPLRTYYDYSRDRERMPQFSDSLEAARQMARYFHVEESSADRDSLRGPGADDPGTDDSDLAEFLEDEASRSAMRTEEKGEHRPDDSQSEWGEMTLETFPLAVPFPARMKGKRNRATAEGAVFAHPDRMMSDQRVFRTKPQRPDGGAVLIDMSGSMHLDTDDVRSLIALMPAGIIAVYCGELTTGVLRIIAKNGRRVRDEHLDPGHGGNTVDGPALDWLANQSGPRLWVSDGRVVGRRDGRDSGMGRNLCRDCADKCRRSAIVRVENQEAAREFMRKIGR